MKNRIFVVFICIAFLAVMAGVVYAKGNIGAEVAEPDNHICEPMSQGFWKRLCDGRTERKKVHSADALLDGIFDEELCEDLQVRGNDRKDPCTRAYSQLAALYYNLDAGILIEECEVFYDGFEDVGDMLDEIESLLGGVPETCEDIEDLAGCINSRDCFEDPYYVANLFNVEQNTFYKDIYAKISNWLNDLLKIS